MHAHCHQGCHLSFKNAKSGKFGLFDTVCQNSNDFAIFGLLEYKGKYTFLRPVF